MEHISHIIPHSPTRRGLIVASSARVVDTYACLVCKDMGWLRRDVPFDHPSFGKLVRCQCQAVEHARLALAQTYTWLGAPDDQAQEMEGMTFASFQPQANGKDVAMAYKRARGYAEALKAQVDRQKNALLIGPFGTGKTHLACAILNTVRAAGVGCLFASGNELFQTLYDRDFDETLIRRATETPLLCLDDLDKMQVRDDGSYQKATLFTLFNARAIARRPVIITANADDSWKRWLDGSVLSRLFGKERVEAIAIRGQDYRMIGGA